MALLTLISAGLGMQTKEFYAAFGVIFAILMLVSLIFACVNISKFKGLKKLHKNNDNIEIPRKLNLSFVILGFSCLPFIILINCLLDKIKYSYCCCNKSKESPNNDINTNKSTENKPEIHNESEANINK